MAISKPASPAAKPNLSATELELKRRGRRRLIGAFTLGLLAIVFLPMLFDSAPKKDQANSREIAIQVPPKDGLAPLPAPVISATPSVAAGTTAAPVVVIAKPDTKAEPKPKPDDPAPATIPAPALVVKPAVMPPTAAPVPKSAVTAVPKLAATAMEPPLKEGFAVQIGAYKDAANAQQIVALMKEAKLPVFTDIIATSGGSVTRVRVGPFATKEKADSALVQVKLAGSDGKIVPLK